jgi:3-methyladenine DNA glycosylase AlkC
VSASPAEPGSGAAPALKDWFDEARYRSLAALLKAAAGRRFQERRFLELALAPDLPVLGLMDRLRRATAATHAALPLPYRDQVAVLKQVAPGIGHEFVAIYLCDFVAAHGADDPAFSLEALAFLTRFGSAEFAVRPFLQRDLRGTLAVMQEWAGSDCRHARRLASEGSRPRLPWGMRLAALVADPAPAFPILTRLRDDSCPSVRRSVANHINDISKDHPGLALDLLEGWDLGASACRLWIARHACRTLVKRCHPRALALLGFEPPAAIRSELAVTPAAAPIGSSVELDAVLHNDSAAPQRLAVDFVVHYVKASGKTSAKVFKWSVQTVAPGATLRLRKELALQERTTRRHHPGTHKIALQISGAPGAAAEFELLPGDIG